MSNRRFIYEITLSFGNDEDPGYSEVECKFAYSVDWGSEPTRNDPGSGSMVDDCELLTVEGKPRPWDMGYGFITDDDFAEMCLEEVLDKHEGEVIAEAADTVRGEEDDYRERMWEDRRLEP